MTLSRACSATSWENFFLSQSARLSNFSTKYRATQTDPTVSNQYDSQWSNVSLIHARLQELAGTCTVPFDLPLDGKWEPDFQDITALFQNRLNQAVAAYQECLTTAEYYIQDIPCDAVLRSCCNGSRHYDPSYVLLAPFGPETPAGDVLPGADQYNGSLPRPEFYSCSNLVYPPKQGARISYACHIDAVASVTTPGFNMTVRIQRYTTYYIVKLFIPVIACVAFALTAFAIPFTELAARLTVIVPAAIALTAIQVIRRPAVAMILHVVPPQSCHPATLNPHMQKLCTACDVTSRALVQVLVVATDIPSVSYIPPTTAVMLCAYICQVFIALESVVVYLVWCAHCMFSHCDKLSLCMRTATTGSSRQNVMVQVLLRWQQCIDLWAAARASGRDWTKRKGRTWGGCVDRGRAAQHGGKFPDRDTDISREGHQWQHRVRGSQEAECRKP